MKIILITEDFPPMLGGIAVFLSELSSGLTKWGNDVRVLVNCGNIRVAMLQARGLVEPFHPAILPPYLTRMRIKPLEKFTENT